MDKVLFFNGSTNLIGKKNAETKRPPIRLHFSMGVHILRQQSQVKVNLLHLWPDLWFDHLKYFRYAALFFNLTFRKLCARGYYVTKYRVLLLLYFWACLSCWTFWGTRTCMSEYICSHCKKYLMNHSSSAFRVRFEIDDKYGLLYYCFSFFKIVGYRIFLNF